MQATWKVRSYDDQGIVSEATFTREDDAASEVADIKAHLPSVTRIFVDRTARKYIYCTDWTINERDEWEAYNWKEAR